jgi:hypothetical protein
VKCRRPGARRVQDAKDVDVVACHAVRNEERSARNDEFARAWNASRPAARRHVTKAVYGNTDPARYGSHRGWIFTCNVGTCLFEVGNSLARIADPQAWSARHRQRLYAAATSTSVANSPASA